jgi:hypothetical protein
VRSLVTSATVSEDMIIGLISTSPPKTCTHKPPSFHSGLRMCNSALSLQSTLFDRHRHLEVFSDSSEMAPKSKEQASSKRSNHDHNLNGTPEDNHSIPGAWQDQTQEKVYQPCVQDSEPGSEKNSMSSFNIVSQVTRPSTASLTFPGYVYQQQA